MAKVIGKVSATEKCPSTIDEFYFWTDKKQILSPFDVVKVNHESGSITFGVIEEIMNMRDDNELSTETAIMRLQQLLEGNKHLIFVQKALALVQRAFSKNQTCLLTP